MLQLTLKKLIQGILMLLIVSSITFTLLSSAGGDALTNLRDNPQISEQTIRGLQKVYGLDRPFLERYGSWLGRSVQGDLGESFSFRIPVASLVWSRFLNTVILSVTALIFAVGVSFALGFLSVRYKSRTLATVVEALILVTASAPRMVLALFALLVMLRMGAIGPASGSIGVFQLVMGAVVLSMPVISVLLAQLRSGLSDAMNEDFVTVARAKGLSEWNVITQHAWRASLNPFLTMAGVSLGGLFGGSVIVETVLGWPGIGALMIAAVRGRDVPLVMGVVITASAAVWLGNAVAEYLQFLNDKRLRSGDLT
ncbi:MAG: ABC transporter permease [Pyrinomonadaceae bacterium]